MYQTMEDMLVHEKAIREAARLAHEYNATGEMWIIPRLKDALQRVLAPLSYEDKLRVLDDLERKGW